MVIAVAVMAVGCAGLVGSTLPRSAQDDCERSGGVWRPALSYCEVQSGSSPI